MAKMTRFRRSQNAHKRLHAKSNVKFGSFADDIKADYHFTVFQLQDRSKKIISKKDRKTLYAHSHEKILGYYPPGSTTRYSDAVKVIRKYGGDYK